ncbi:hypothetical protein TNCV_490131 [Trichonephila clavipes]|nr:hypothetical protein TNCV_490131 [Trichonephila clavipes]
MSVKFAWELSTGGLTSYQTDHLTGTSAQAPQGPRSHTLRWAQQKKDECKKEKGMFTKFQVIKSDTWKREFLSITNWEWSFAKTVFIVSLLNKRNVHGKCQVCMPNSSEDE